ncbi:MAG: hypothetical protein SNJ69_03860 [Chloroflexaceae bacterium]
MVRYRRAGVLLVILVLLLVCNAPARGQSVTTRVYLPLLASPPIVTIQFAADANRETGELLNPTTEFDVGLDLLWVSTRLQGYTRRQMRLDFTFPDGNTLTGSTRTVLDQDFRYTTAYCLTTAFTCERGRQTLPSGPYTARVFVDGQQVAEAVAIIR